MRDYRRDKRMSRKDLGELVFCIAGIMLFFFIMAFALWGIVSKPWFHSSIVNLLSSIFVTVSGLVGFVLYIWVFIVLTRGITTVHEDSSGVTVQPKTGRPVRINSSQMPRAYMVRTAPYLGTPSQKALLFLSPKIFVVPQSHPAWERFATRAIRS